MFADNFINKGPPALNDSIDTDKLISWAKDFGSAYAVTEKTEAVDAVIPSTDARSAAD